MESFDHKMSKSDPNRAILLHDDEKILSKKLRKAYLDPEDSESPVYELIEHIILPEQGSLEVVPNPEYGVPSSWNELAAIKASVADGSLHPFDVKMAVANGISNGLSCVSEFFENSPETLIALESLSID